MESCWDEMVWCEFQNIEELEANEAHEASEVTVVPSLNEFLLNVSSNQVKVPVDFDPWSWPESVPPGGASQ